MAMVLFLILSFLVVHSSWSFSLSPLSFTKLKPNKVNGLLMSSVIDALAKRMKLGDSKPTLAFDIKQANSYDLDAIVSLRVSTFYPEVCGAGMSNEPMKRRVLETLKRRERDGSVNFVAQEGIFAKNLLGSVEISPSDFKGTDMEHIGAKRKLYLVDLCIKENVRNMGIASSLLRTIEEYALAKEFREVYMHVETDNIVARNLYDKNGYVARNCEKSKAFTTAKLKRPAEGLLLLCKMLSHP